MVKRKNRSGSLVKKVTDKQKKTKTQTIKKKNPGGSKISNAKTGSKKSGFKKKIAVKKKSSSRKKILPKSKKKVVLPKKRKYLKKYKPRKINEGLKRYKAVRVILKKFLDENGIDFGDRLTGKVKALFENTKTLPLKFIEQNIGKLYKLHVRDSVGSGNFDDSFPFYNAKSTFAMPKYQNIEVSYRFNDGITEHEFEGLGGDDLLEDFDTSGMYKYCRQNYNVSPVAEFRLVDTDGITFADYVLDPGTGQNISNLPPDQKITPDGTITPKNEKEPSKEEKNDQKKDLEKEIELQKSRLDLLKEENRSKELEIEKQKAEKETIESKLKTVEKLREMGMSMDDIKKYLGI